MIENGLNAKIYDEQKIFLENFVFSMLEKKSFFEEASFCRQELLFFKKSKDKEFQSVLLCTERISNVRFFSWNILTKRF